MDGRHTEEYGNDALQPNKNTNEVQKTSPTRKRKRNLHTATHIPDGFLLCSPASAYHSATE